jgi:hypothetical protein
MTTAHPTASMIQTSRARAWRRVLQVALLAMVMMSPAASAQYLRNQSMHFGLGWQALGTTWDAILGDRYWNVTDQPLIVTGYSMAIGYQTFFDLQATLGGGFIKAFDGTDAPPVFSFSVSPGLRYNFLEERIRPFVAGYIDLPFSVVDLTNSPFVPRNLVLAGAPALWAGLRAGGGVEWIALDEVGFQIDLTMAGYLGLLNQAPQGGRTSVVLPSTSARLLTNVYF